jgi:anti-sigma B factor antagonist
MSQSVVAGQRIDAATVGALRGCLNDAIVAGAGSLVLDLSAVQTIDVTGLAMLLGIERRATSAGRQLLLRGVPPRVARLLRATGLSRVLRVEEPLRRQLDPWSCSIHLAMCGAHHGEPPVTGQ